MRWRHPTRGLRESSSTLFHLGGSPPGLFGSLDRLGPRRRPAARRAPRAPMARPAEHRFLSVNLSPVALVQQPGFVTFVRDVLDASGLRPEQLILEVTETAEPGPAWRCDRTHRGQGAGCAAGDRRFRHWLRVSQPAARQPVRRHQDRREPPFTRCRTDPRAAAIASGIIDLGRRLGAHTIAEEFEGATEVTELLDTRDVILGQGFHFAPGLLARGARRAARSFRLPGRAPPPDRRPPRSPPARHPLRSSSEAS